VYQDVVELAQLRAEVEDARLAQIDVRQPQLAHDGLPVGDLSAGQIDADKPAVRRAQRHRDQVAAAGGAELQHAATVRMRGVEPEQPGDRRQAVGMRLRERVDGVGDGLVRGARCLLAAPGGGRLARVARRFLLLR
jgi:hypothetical protein